MSDEVQYKVGDEVTVREPGLRPKRCQVEKVDGDLLKVRELKTGNLPFWVVAKYCFEE